MLLGNLTADPVSKASKKGGEYTTFSLATNRDWKSKDGEDVHETHFHKVVAFGKLGENIVAYFKKGAPMLLSGRLSTRSYLSKEGRRRTLSEVIAEDFNFVPRSPSKDGLKIDAQTGEVTDASIDEIAERFKLNKGVVQEVVDY